MLPAASLCRGKVVAADIDGEGIEVTAFEARDAGETVTAIAIWLRC